MQDYSKKIPRLELVTEGCGSLYLTFELQLSLRLCSSLNEDAIAYLLYLQQIRCILNILSAHQSSQRHAPVALRRLEHPCQTTRTYGCPKP